MSDKKVGKKKRLPHWVLWPKSNNVREHLTILTVLMNMPSNKDKDSFVYWRSCWLICK